ncbi:GNAT family N-acetyltransferase [Catellatospora chokoriensis]|uniref:N-acetyltransferase n=1 Tax=Catellatospora chokoriensis TaxID=310353 RepID=A0A8J3JSV6_9ACTN|nr:GNAT family N-acetyltransferase [Catellatospora chokoriensis]GIF90456.1 N-acetyltransferase [Catellatospora chokoriensis]
MIADLTMRALAEPDLLTIPAAFAELGWPGKDVQQFRCYLAEQAAGDRDVIVAELGGRFAGYVTVAWASGYLPFRVEGIPEIQDFNVLPAHRQRGVGSALMDAAEMLVATRTPVVGLGVGLYGDYGAAQRMYVKRGYIPDGRGIMYAGEPVPPGESVVIDDDACLMYTRELNQTLPPAL